MPTLKRSLSLPLLVLYGLGTTIGAGIYALLGELAGASGYMAPASFLLASFMAALTAFSFAELSGRFPRCAGAALYVREGFDSERLSTLVGLLVIGAGLVSSAALVIAFTGYLHDFMGLDRLTIIIAVCVLLGITAAWGIAESVFIAASITIIEIGGLLLLATVVWQTCLHAGPNWFHRWTRPVGGLFIQDHCLPFMLSSVLRIWWMWLKRLKM